MYRSFSRISRNHVSPARWQFVRAMKINSSALINPVYDVSGNLVSCSVNDISILNEAITAIINSASNPSKLLEEAIDIDNQCLLAKAVLPFYCMHNLKKESSEIINKLLLELNEKHQRGELLPRETFLAAAALAWTQGDFRRAGLLLEGSLISSPMDPITLKLAQESYLRAGDVTAAVGCVARSMQVFTDSNMLQTNVQAMLSIGYLEIGRYSDAEDISHRAITKSDGLDILATKTLLTTYVLTGSSSEVVNWIEKSRGGDIHTGASLHTLLFLKGLAHTQRGNNRGASNAVAELISSIHTLTETEFETIDEAPVEKGVILTSPPKRVIKASRVDDYLPSLCLATMLLWQISLHTMNSAVKYKWRELFYLVQQLNLPVGRPKSLASDPSIEMCVALIFAANANPSFTASREASTADVAEQGPALFGWLKTSIFSSNPLSIQRKEAEDVNLEETIAEATKELEKFMAGYDKSFDSNANSNQFAALLSVESPTRLSRVDGSALDPVERLKLVKSLCDGLVAFAGGDFSNAADTLNGIQAMYRPMGLSSIHRYLLDQTLTESLLQSGRFKEAQVLLCERTCLASNDAQAWFRLGAVFGQLGDDFNASKARYNAWQLGIGQGGFGGPK